MCLFAVFVSSPTGMGSPPKAGTMAHLSAVYPDSPENADMEVEGTESRGSD